MKINFNCYRAYFQQGIVFILYAFYPLMSADSGLGTISGRVYNIVGAPVADVHVLLENNSGADVSNSRGEFAVTDIAPGIYTISFSHISYNPRTLEGIVVIEGRETRLDPVILTARIFDASAISVTATRMDIEKEKYTSQINVVTNKKINALQPKTSAEALREEPGISIQKTNHGGGSANIRGLSSNQILLMVDGVRLNNSTYRRGNHQYLTTVDYQMTGQMEIIKGPSSVIHGSDALGGTINIVTKEPGLSSAGFEWQLRGNVRYATADNERLLRLEPVLKNERWAWQAGLSLKSFGDLRRGKNSKYPVLENATDGLYQKPTGFDAWDIDSKIMFSFVPGQSLALAYQKTTQNDVPRYDKYENNDYYQWIYHPQGRELVYLRYRKTDSPFMIQSHISFQIQKEGRKIQKTPRSSLTRESDQVNTLGFTFQIGNHIGSHNISTGMDIYLDHVSSLRFIESNPDLPERGRYPDGAQYLSTGLFLQDLYPISDRWSVMAGGRFSFYRTEFDPDKKNESVNIFKGDYQATTFNLGTVFKPDGNWSVRSNLSQGFRAPNLSDLAKLGESKGNVFEIPNYSLTPEDLVSFDLGTEYTTNLDKFSVTFFYTKLTDLISSADAEYNGLPEIIIDSTKYQLKSKQNTGQAFIWGIETDFQYQFFADVSAYGNFAFTYGYNTTLNEPMDGIPPFFGLFGLVFEKPDLKISFYTRFAGSQSRLSSDDKDDPRIPPGGTPGWSIINIRGLYRINSYLRVTCMLENVLDLNYREHGSGINGPGRNLVFSGELLL